MDGWRINDESAFPGESVDSDLVGWWSVFVRLVTWVNLVWMDGWVGGGVFPSHCDWQEVTSGVGSEPDRFSRFLKLAITFNEHFNFNEHLTDLSVH